VTVPDVKRQIKCALKKPFCNWDGESPDAKFLKLLVENGAVEGLTAGQIQMDPWYFQIKQYKNSTLASALHNAHIAVKSQMDLQCGTGSFGMFAMRFAAQCLKLI
jgi:hypothetical protein